MAQNALCYAGVQEMARLKATRLLSTLCLGERAFGGNPNATVDGRNPAPPQKPWNGDLPVKTNKQWLPMVS